MKKNIYLALFCFLTIVGFSQATPTANFNIGNPKCINVPIQYTDQSTGAPTSWTWTFTAGSPATSNAQNPSITYTSPGTYAVYLIATNANGSSTVYSSNVTVSSTPTITVSSPTICNGSSGALNANGASTYTWVPGNATGSTYNVSPNSTTGYTVTGTSSAGCKSSASTIVTVLPRPTVSVNSGSMCIGSPYTLTPSGAVSYSWSTGSTSPTIAVSPTTDTPYSVTGTGANGCKSLAVSNVTVFPLPVISLTSGTICPGQSVPLYASGANTYTWSTFTELPSATVSPTITTTYSCSGSFLNGCTSSATTTVYVTAAPDFSLTTSTVCSGITATLVATPITASISSFFWSNGTNGTSMATSQTVTTTYSCTANTTGGCSSTKTTTLYIYPSPVLASSTGTVCSGKSFVINASGAVSYTWTTGSNNSSITVTPTVTSSYGFTGESVNGCINSGIATVSVVALPNITIPARSVCLGKAAILSGQGGNFYVWSTSATTPTISVSPTTNTTYTCIGTAVSGCSNIAVTTVTVFPTPIVPLTGATICSGQTATLTASSANTYTWSNGNHSSSIFVVPLVTTSYSCIGLSLNNCEYQSTTVVNVVSVTAPTIVQSGYVLTSSSPTGNQWYLNGSPIVGATSQAYTFTQNGNYSVIVTGSNNCQSDFANISIFDTALPDFDLKKAISIFPNPTNGNINISMLFEKANNEEVTIKVYDASGQLIREEAAAGTNTLVNLENMSGGIYIVEVSVKQYRAHFKVLKL